MRRLLLFGVALLSVPVWIAGCGPEKEKEDESPDSITVGPASSDVVLGSSIQLAATAHFADGSTQDVTDLASWTTNTGAIATVADGLVSTLSTGDVLVTASYDLRNASALVDVRTPPPFTETEPNDDPLSATDLGAETVFAGTCSLDDFDDLYTLSVNSGNTVIAASWTEGPNLEDIDIYLYDLDFNEIGSDTASPPEDTPAVAPATLTTATTILIDIYCATDGPVDYIGFVNPL